MKAAGVVLPPLSALYGAAVRTRLAAYSRGLLRVSRLARPVISVGNITVGGTGKTPLVEWICRAVAEDGKQVCILTRGYRRERPNERVVVSDGKTIQAEVDKAGDEPFLLAKSLIGKAAVISDANRLSAGEWAIHKLGTDIFVLDDGFQHLQLFRNLNVLVIDATNPFGGRQLLPAGRLREPLSAMARADCTVITRADYAENIESLRAEITHRTSKRPVFTSTMRSDGLRTLNDRMASASPGIKVAAFCGVGNPNSFFSQLQSSGYAVVCQQQFPDHHSYTQADIDSVVKSATTSRAEALVTTTKDAVKLTELNIQFDCYVLPIEIVLDQADDFRKLLRRATT